MIKVNDTQNAQVEADRQRLISELTLEGGESWREQNLPGTFGCHELLDRTSLMAEQLERILLSHPACIQRAEWYALAESALASLHELYQQVGDEHLSAENLAVSKTN